MTAAREQREKADLRGPLAARLVPLLVVAFAAIAISAPLAHYWRGCAELRETAARDASDIGVVLAREAEQRPVLWRYDSIRLVQHLRAYEDRPDVARIEIVDAHARLLDASASDAEDGLVWASAPIAMRGELVGHVWIGMRLDALRGRSLVLLAFFAALALSLVVLVHAITMRSAALAEDRIDGLVERLANARSEQRVRMLGARAVAAQEEERRAIARDLHDTVGQALTAIRIQAEVLSARAGDPVAVRTVARRVAEASDATIEEVRRAIDRLGPAVLDELGLEAALARLLEQVAEVAGLEVTTHIAEVEQMPAAIETTCYRIAQEALTNVARHAGATRVTVSLRLDGEAIVLEIRDDGRGLEGDKEEPGHGLRSMRERAELLGGSLAIEPAPEGGTWIRARLPLPSEPSAETPITEAPIA